MATSIRVLHVDDEPAFGDLVADFLEREDERFSVETAANADEGLRCLSDRPFDCVVSDYEMPGRDGIEFLEAVREDHPDLPFILYTGKGSEEIASEAVSAGVTDYLQKEAGTSHYAVLGNRIRNVVEQQRSRHALVDSQKRLSHFFEQSPLGVIEWDVDFDVVRLNESAEEVLGYAESELVGRSWHDIVPASTEDEVEEAIAALRENDGGTHRTFDVERKDGERIVCEWHSGVVTDETGDVEAAFSKFQDVSERHRRRQRRERQQDALVRLATDDAVTAGEFDTAVQRITETAAEVLDVARANVWLFDGDTLRCVDHYDHSDASHADGMTLEVEQYPDYVDALTTGRTIDAAAARRDSRTAELADGYLDEHDIGALLDATIRSAGEVIGVVCHENVGGPREWTDDEIQFAGDVADLVYRALRNRQRVQQQREIEFQRSLLEAQQESVLDGMLVVDDAGEIISYNDQFVELWGIPEKVVENGDDEAVLDLAMERLVNPEAFRRRVEYLNDHPAEDARDELEMTDGRILDRYSTALVGDDGTHFGRLWTFRDVTEQRRYERELEETNDLLEAVFDASPAAILSYDRDGHVQLWNPAAEEIYGWSADEVLGERLPMIPEGKEDEEREIYERVFGGESITNLELSRETKSGEMIDISLSTAPVRNQEGAVIGNVSVAQDITERKEREQELEAIQRRMELALSGTRSVIWERDVQSDSFTRHGPVEDVYGDTDHGVGETIDDFYRMVHPDDRTTVREAMETAVETGGEYAAEYRIDVGGDVRWFRTRAEVRTDDQGRSTKVVGLATDVTELKRREHELQRYETIVEALGDPVYALDAEGHYTFVNDAYLGKTGYSREEIIGIHVSEVVPDVDVERGRDYIRQLLKDRERSSITWEAERLTVDGERIPCEHHMALLPFDENGEFQGTAGVIRDVSDRREHEERLEKTTDRMHLALQGANSWIWDWNLKTDTTTQSAVSGILGVEEATVTRPIDDFLDQIHPEDREVFLAAKEQAVSGDRGYHAEYRLIEGDEVRWIDARGQVYQDDSGESARMIGIATDVTEEKQRALERQWMQRALDQSSEAVFVSDPETGQIEFVNDTACEQLGYERDELLERTILDIQPDLSTAEEWAAHIDRVRTEGHVLFEGTHVRRDGTQFPVEVNTGIVEIERQDYLLGIARDITHRKERERELERQIEQLDEFASIVSHDLRNPLSVAMGHLELAMDEVDSRRLDTVDRSLKRMQALVDDLLSLAREGGRAADIEAVDLAGVADTGWRTVDTDNAEIRIETDVTVRADRGRLQQLLENLFRNAVEHGGAGVTVSVGRIDDGQGFYVQDDGEGIPDDRREQVFESGYSTAESGTGFGLAIVAKVAETHGWTVSVTDGSEGGVRFEIRDVTLVE